MSNELIYSDATRLAELIRRKEISPVELVQAHLDRIEAIGPKVNAIVAVAKGALEEARRAEAAVLASEELGALHGVPFTVKDSIDTEGVMTQRGSPIFKGRLPDRDATSVARLKKAGGCQLSRGFDPHFHFSVIHTNSKKMFMVNDVYRIRWDDAKRKNGTNPAETQHFNAD